MPNSNKSSQFRAPTVRRAFAKSFRLRHLSIDALGTLFPYSHVGPFPLATPSDPGMDTVLYDLRYAARQLIRSPGFTVVAALTLAVGIGANTALFTLADAILARPLPEIGRPDDLVWLTPFSIRGGRALSMSYPDFRDFRDSTGAFESAAAMGRVDFSISSSGEPTRVRGMLVSADFFKTLQVRMALGRAFLPEDDQPASPNPVAIISYRLWRDRFGGGANVIGQRMMLDGQSFTIVGVVPERFNGPSHSERRDVWVPISLAGTSLPGFKNLLKDRDSWWLEGIGRLAPNVSLERANAALAAVASRIAAEDSVYHRDVTARVTPLRGGIEPNGGNDIYPIAVLAGAVTLLVLLIACANVSNLLLGRAVARRRELAVRLSIGASRGRIVRQLLTESVLLALIATGLGFLMAMWATDVMAAVIPAPIEVSPDLRVLWFTIAIAFATGVAFGVAPAMNATRADVTAALKDATVGVDKSRARLQRGFVVAQISLSLVLLVTAGMFLGAMYKATNVDVHFDSSDRVLAASFNLELNGYTAERGTAFLDELHNRTSALPGVEAVSFTNQVPMGDRHISADVTVQGDAEATRRFGEAAGYEAYQSTVRPDYFRTISIPIARGRDFSPDDRVGAEPVAIVSEDFARRAWPNGDAIGQRISTGGKEGPYLTIVGVARQALTHGLTEADRPIVYTPLRQHPEAMDLTMLVRRSSNATELAPAVRRIVREMDRNLPVYSVQSLAQYRYDRGSESRLGSTLLAIFGGLALLLATIGVYAVMAFSVGQRTREIGVRVALGAARGQIVSLFVREGSRLATVGIVVGVILSIGVAKLLSSMFLGLRVIDAITFAAGSAILGVAALAASWIPARRAAWVDPMVALRNE
jgi:putative ABC transport system permease protein